MEKFFINFETEIEIICKFYNEFKITSSFKLQEIFLFHFANISEYFSNK